MIDSRSIPSKSANIISSDTSPAYSQKQLLEKEGEIEQRINERINDRFTQYEKCIKVLHEKVVEVAGRCGGVADHFVQLTELVKRMESTVTMNNSAINAIIGVAVGAGAEPNNSRSVSESSDRHINVNSNDVGSIGSSDVNSNNVGSNNVGSIGSNNIGNNSDSNSDSNSDNSKSKENNK